ncbi:MAG: endonuclease [Bacteroidota bacterium]
MVFRTICQVLCLFWFYCSVAQPPANYYDGATATGFDLKTQLHEIIDDQSAQSYGSVWTFVETNDLDRYYEDDNTILDIYSENPEGTDPYNFTVGNTRCGNQSSEGDCYNREHSFPASWFDDASPMFTDIHHLFPTDGRVNNFRGNFPFGEVGAANFTSLNGSKRGTATSSLGYSGTVFEPIDEFKGDLARAYFYMATRYEDVIVTWNSPMLNGSTDQVFTDWALEMLLEWHNADPVSSKEEDRNNNAFSFQGNRNPYIDHPEWVEAVWIDQVPISTIADVYAGSNGDEFTIAGIVTTPDYGSTATLFFVQDATAGINVFVQNSTCETTQGDSVLITGLRDEFSNLIEINATSLEVLTNANALPPYQEITTGDLSFSSDLLGSRVQIRDVSIVDDSIWPIDPSSNGVSVPIVVGSTQFQLRIDDASFFNGSAIPCSDFDLAGILSRFNNEIQILPFFESEIMPLLEPNLDLSTSTNIDFADTEVDSESIEMLTISAEELTESLNLVITSGAFAISLDEVNGYSQQLELEPTDGFIPPVTIFIRFAPTIEGDQQGMLQFSSCGISNELALNGEGIVIQDPVLNVNPSTFAFDDQEVSTASAAKAFTVDGIHLTESVSVSSVGEFTISELADQGFVNDLTLDPSNGVLQNVELYVRFAPESTGERVGTISVTSSGLQEEISLTGIGFVPLNPVISVIQDELQFGEVEVAEVSSSLVLNVSGEDLSEDLLITAPEDFDISLAQDGSYSSTLSLSSTDGILEQTSIFVRFVPSSIGAVDRILLLSSSGVSSEVTLQAIAVEAASEILPDVNFISFESFELGQQSPLITFFVEASNLPTDLNLEVNGEFEIALGLEGDFLQSFQIPSVGGDVERTEVAVRVSSETSGIKNGMITLTAGDEQEIIDLSAVIIQPDPVLSLAQTTISFGETVVGVASVPIPFRLSGTFLAEDLVVTAPEEFEISRSANGEYTSSLNLIPVDQEVPETDIYVRFVPISAGGKGAQVTVRSGAVSRGVDLVGLGVDPPALSVENTNFRIYPNPTKGAIIIQGFSSGTFQVTLRTIRGELIFQEIGENNAFQERLNGVLSEVETGIYLLTLNTDAESYVRKLIKR